jgi:predicted phosphoribosyltransferase
MQPAPGRAMVFGMWPTLLHRTAPAFHDRRDAGRRLAAHLHTLGAEHPVIIGLPRGGVPVAFEVAGALHAPLDVVLVRKIGCPSQPELGVGAIGEDDTLVLDTAALTTLGLTRADLEPTIEHERAVLAERRALYRGDREPISVNGRTVILVDDGIATGGTARVAVRILRARAAARIVLAVPIRPPGVEARLGGEVDELVCLRQPEDYFAVGQAYDEFPATGDDEVVELLTASVDGRDAGPPHRDPPPRSAANGGVDWSRIERRDVIIDGDGVTLPGDLRLPLRAHGLVVFAHGSGSSRLSPRNVQVAAALNGRGFGTLLFDLLTLEEAAERRRVFDIPLLVERLLAATVWAARDPETSRSCRWASSARRPAPPRHSAPPPAGRSGRAPSSRAVGVRTSPSRGWPA